MNEQLAYEAPSRYEEPAIVFEGELEIQAGSPLSVIEDFEGWDW